MESVTRKNIQRGDEERKQEKLEKEGINKGEKTE